LLDGIVHLTERSTNQHCDSVECLAGRALRVSGTKSKAELVPLESREDVQVHMRYLLSRGVTIGQKEVNAFTPETALAQRCGEVLPDLYEVAYRGRVQCSKLGNVPSRHDQDMSRVDRLDIQESRTGPSSVHEGARKLATKDLAEGAVHCFATDRLTAGR